MNFTPFAFLAPVISDIPVVAPPQIPYIWVGGNFTTYKANNINNILKVFTSGSIDSTFNIGAGTAGQILAVAVQNDGKVILGGAFTAYSGSSFTRIVRINPNGTVDSTFNGGTGFNADVYSILASGSNIYVGGNFTTYSGSTATRMVRLNASGTIDATYNVGAGASGIVQSIVSQSDNKIVLGGAFANYSGSAVGNIVRTNTNGTRDTTYVTGGGVSTAVTKVLVQPDGKILAVGNFTTYSGSGTNATRIVRTNVSGTRDADFITGAGFNVVAYALALEPNGKILVGGNFTTYSGSSYNRIIRLNASGSVDTTFNPGTGFDAFAGTNNEILTSGSFTYVASNFLTYSGSNIRGIIRLESSGTIDNTFNYGTASANLTGRGVGVTNTNSGVRAMAFSGSNGLFLAGQFSTYQEPIYVRSAMLSSSGNISSSYNGDAIGFSNGIVHCAITQSDGKILVGGSFTAYGATTINRIARINKDGSRDTNFVVGAGFNSTVHDIYQQSDGKILVGGAFTTYSGSTTNFLTRLNLSGSIDTTFAVSSSLNNSAYSITQQSDGKILVAGNFTTYSSSVTTNATRIVRINLSGSKDDTLATNTGFTATMNKIKQQTDNKILVCGGSTTFNGAATYSYIYRLTNSGALDNSFNSGTTPNFPNGIIYNFDIASDGKVVLTGDFTTYSGSSYSRIVRTNNSGAIDTTFNPGTGFDSMIATTTLPTSYVKIDPAGPIYIGGNFTSYSGSSLVRSIAKINSNGTISSDWNYGTTPLFNNSGSGFNNYVSTIIQV